MRWAVVAVGSMALLFAGALAAQSELRPFVDGGSRASLEAALHSAISALPVDGPRRALLADVRAGLGRGESVAETLARATRPQPPVGILLTGYYEPVLRARRAPTGRFRHPLYRPPEATRDRERSRAEIDHGALEGKGLELFWLEDPVEGFFLHVQGSGRLDLGRGSTVRVGYAGNNGRSYHSIGKELVSRGVLAPDEATAPAIKKWLRRNPDEAFAVLHTNPRYIFFREVDVPPHQGPSGAMGAPLVPYRSVAVDPTVTPPGSLGLLTAPMPDGTTLRHVVIAMDQGAAIRGKRRLDLFLGAGAAAGKVAGVLRAEAQVVWLVERPPG